MFIPFSGTVAKSSIEMLLFGQIIVNTLWHEKTDEEEWNVGSLVSLNTGLANWWSSFFAEAVSGSVDLMRIISWKMDHPESLYSEYTPTSPLSGQLSGSCAPSGTCVAIKFASTLTGRSYRGRNYISGIPETYIGGNQILGSYRELLLTQYDQLHAEVVAEVECQHVVASKRHNNAWRAAGVTVPVAEYSVVNLDIDSQRNRLSGRGS